MSPLLHTPTLTPRLKFCSKEAKTSYFYRYARPIPKNQLQYSFTDTVTEYQKSVYECFHSWSRTWIFEMEIGVLPMSC